MSKVLINLVDEVVRNNDIPTTDLDGEVGMIQIETGKYFSLEGVSSAIWHLIDSPISVDQLVKKLMSKYEVDEATCINHTLQFLENLLDLNLIHLVTTEK